MDEYVITKSGVKVYKDYKDAIIVDKDNPALKQKAEKEKFHQGKARGLSKFGSEHSEDAVTWNVFRSLILNKRINLLFDESTHGEFVGELFWNLCTGSEDSIYKAWHINLNAFSEKIKKSNKSSQSGHLTEPDILLCFEESIIFVEAKFKTSRFKGDDSAGFYKIKPYLVCTGQNYKDIILDDYKSVCNTYYQLLRHLVTIKKFPSVDNYWRPLKPYLYCIGHSDNHKKEIDEFKNSLNPEYKKMVRYLSWQNIKSKLDTSIDKNLSDYIENL